MRFRIIGLGGVGRAFAKALVSVGWQFDRGYGRDDDISEAAAGVPVLLICVPDKVVATVAKAVEIGDAVVMHVAGSLGLDVLSDHERVGSVHPLMSVPDPDGGAERLLDRCYFAISGDPLAETLVNALGGHAFAVGDDQRALYHAAAAVASNHLVALASQVDRLARSAGIPSDVYWPLMLATITNIRSTNPASALTGPAARGDWDTLRAHASALESISDSESSFYRVLAAEVARIAGTELPKDLQ